MNLINPYDLGKNQIAENYQKIDIDDLTRSYNLIAKKQFLESEISCMDKRIILDTSRTNFNGKRYWFVCPNCQRRIRIVYVNQVNHKIGCVRCLRIRYAKSRYKNMLEGDIYQVNSIGRKQ